MGAAELGFLHNHTSYRAMQLTGNTGVERIELQGTLPDGAILQEAYKFFVEYRGGVMDYELTYNLIKHLWVTGMIDNIKLLLPAYAKKQLSDSGGRKVVDKMFDVSLNRRIVEWTGTDRPEYTDIDGISKVCVELEEENLVTESNDLTEPEWTPSGAAVSIPSETFRDLPVSLVEATDTAAGWRSVRWISPVFAEADPNPFWEVYVKPVNNVRYVYLTSTTASGTVFLNSTNRSTVFADLEQVEVVTHNEGTTAEIEKVEDGWFRIAIKRDVIVSDNANEAWISVGISDGMVGGTDATEVAYNSQSILVAFASAAINKRYSTNPIYTNGSTVTRLAPFPKIDRVDIADVFIALIDDLVFDDQGLQRYAIVQTIDRSFGLFTRNFNRLQFYATAAGEESILLSAPLSWQPVNTRKKWFFSIYVKGTEVQIGMGDPETGDLGTVEAVTEGLNTGSHDLYLSGPGIGSEDYSSHYYMSYKNLTGHPKMSVEELKDLMQSMT